MTIWLKPLRLRHCRNGPLGLVWGKIGGALATGCTLVLKPAEQTPLVALRIARTRSPRVSDKEKTRVAEAMLKDTVNYSLVGDVIDHLAIGRTTFDRYFPPDRIRELRNQP
jgi:hypothetical protein